MNEEVTSTGKYCDTCRYENTIRCDTCIGTKFCQQDVTEPSRYENSKHEVLPPLGLKPRRVHDYERVKDIVAAMQRYIDADKPIPVVWAEELWEILMNYEEVTE